MTGSLSLTMIIRNEAERLPAFLAAHRGLADELVVVDTGSTDRSITMVREAGGRVIEAPWQDNFAVARNIALDEAHCDWILFLDADERVSRQDFAHLRGAIAAGVPQAFLQETWNYCRGTTHLEWQPVTGRYPAEEEDQTGFFVARRVGLFPNDGRLRFSGRLHESVLPAVEAAGLPLVKLTAPVHHYGYVGDEAANDARAERYRRLAALKIQETPDDPAAQLEWATILLEEGETRAAIDQLAKLTKNRTAMRPVVRGLVLAGRLRREMSHAAKARELLTEAVARDPDFVFGWLEIIRLEAQEKNWDTAEELLQRAEKRFGGHQPQLLREALRIQVKQHQLMAALQTAEELVRTCPQWQEIRDLRDRLVSYSEKSGGT